MLATQFPHNYLENLKELSKKKSDKNTWRESCQKILDAVNEGRKKAGYPLLNYGILGKKLNRIGVNENNIDNFIFDLNNKCKHDNISFDFAFNIMTKIKKTI